MYLFHNKIVDTYNKCESENLTMNVFRNITNIDV